MNKQIKKISIYTKLKEPGSKEFLSFIQEYNKTGLLLFNKEYNSDNKLISIIETSYNEKDQPITETIEHIEDGFKEKKYMEYDNDGILISQKIEYFEGAYSIKKFNRNNDENTLEIKTYDEDGEIEESKLIKFDDKKRIISQSDFNERGKLTEKLVNIYDENSGNIIKKEEYSSKNKIEKVHHYYYDNNKLLGVKAENRKGKTIDWAKLEYDNNGNIAKQKTMSGAMLVFEYDNDNNISKEIHYNPNGEIINEIITNKDKEGNILKENSLDKEVRYLYEWY